MGYLRTSSNLAMRMISCCYALNWCETSRQSSLFLSLFLSGQLMPLIGLDDIDKNGGFVSSGVFYTLFGDLKLLSNFVAGALCLALFEGAYITEIVRRHPIHPERPREAACHWPVTDQCPTRHHFSTSSAQNSAAACRPVHHPIKDLPSCH